MEAVDILRPVFVVGVLTTVMMIWMIATRVPTMTKLGIDAQEGQDTRKLRELLPHSINRVANNYNHLFEQPTLFYAVAISIAVLGQVDSFYVGCAWTYAVLRILHSLVQALIDNVTIRFGLFALSWVALGTMLVRVSLANF